IPRRTAKARAAELLDFVQLRERADSRVEPLSGGMKRRLTIARALVNNPDIALLDEPTTGLDPQARHLVWDRLFRLKQQGMTLVLTTHYMDEAEQLCDRLVVMDTGRIVAEGSPRSLIDRYSTREVVELRFPDTAPEDVAGKLAELAERVEVLPDRILLYADDGDAAAEAVHRLALGPASVLVRRSGLEWSRTYHSLAAAPLRIVDILGGDLLFIVFRLLTTSVVFLGIAAAFGAIHSPWAVAVPFVCALLGLAVATPVHALSARMTSDSYFSLLLRFGLIPLGLFSGVYFPVTALPSALRLLASLSPLWHATEVCRAATLPGVPMS